MQFFIRGDKVEELEEISSKLFQTNVVGNIHLFNLFLPLVMKGNMKKVITISSGHADLDLIKELEIETSALYAASKAAMNVIVAKFNEQYKKDGVLFVSISPGVVEVGHFVDGTCLFQYSSSWVLELFLNHVNSHSRADSALVGFHGKPFNICVSFQGRDSSGRGRPNS